MMNLKRTTQWIGLPAALMLTLALPGGAEPAWKKVQGKLAGQKEASDARAAEAADTAAGAESGPVDPEVEAMRAKAAEDARESGNLQEVPVEAQSGGPASDSNGTLGLPTAGDGKGGAGSPQINLGKEGDDSSAVKNVFTDPQFLKMIGEKPVFIYNAVDKPDPMVFPPIRIAAIYLECIAEADALLLEGGFTSKAGAASKSGAAVNRDKIRDAVNALNRARSLNDPRYATQIERRLIEISEFLRRLDQEAGAHATPAPTPVGLPAVEVKDPELPLEITEATTGVIAGETSFCLVGDSLLKVGDAVPSYPEVTVSAITAGSVTFTVRAGDRTKDFAKEVKGYDEPGDVGQLSSGSRDRSSRKPARRR